MVHVVTHDIHLHRMRLPADIADRNQIGSPSTVRVNRVTPAARNSSVPSKPSSSRPGSAWRPDSTSTAGNDDRRNTPGNGTVSTPA